MNLEQRQFYYDMGFVIEYSMNAHRDNPFWYTMRERPKSVFLDDTTYRLAPYQPPKQKENLMTNLQDKAIIIRVNAKAWTARRYDRQSTDELLNKHSASKAAARVNTYLMAGADERLQSIHQAIREMRDFVERNTVPWDTNGGRLITPENWFNLRGDIKKKTDHFQIQVDNFINHYPSDVERAKISLAELADRVEYPSTVELRGMFGLAVVPEALPLVAPSDPRYGITQEELNDLKANIEATVNQRLNDSLAAQWKRLKGELERLSASVTGREGTRRTPVYETTLENLRTTAHVLKSMNITEDEDITSICNDVLQALCDVNIDTLRSSLTQRSELRDATKDILERFKGIL